MTYFEAPNLTFLFDLDGERVKGEVILGGDDWITVREDGTVIQDVRILLRADDHELIMMPCRGIRTGQKEVLARLENNEDVDHNEYYFRMNSVLETVSEKYNWMNQKDFVSTGKRLDGKVQYSVYQVD